MHDYLTSTEPQLILKERENYFFHVYWGLLLHPTASNSKFQIRRYVNWLHNGRIIDMKS